MLQSLRIFALTLLAFTATGCSWVSGLFSDDNSEPPAELVSFDETIQVKKLWSEGIGDGTNGQYLKLTPAVNGDAVYAADADGLVIALNKTNGKTIWKTKSGLPISGGVGIGEGLVLVGTSDARLAAFSQETGELAWTARVTSEILSVPKASLGVAVARTVDGRIFAFDAQTGEQKWVYSGSVPVLSLRGTSSPVFVSNGILAGFDNGRMAIMIADDGRVAWEATVTAPSGRSELERIVDIDSDPIVNDAVVFVAAFQGRVTAISLQTGELLWVRGISSYAGIGADFNQLYISDEESHVWALDQSNGVSVWRQDDLHLRQVTAPTAHDAYVVVGDYAGYLHWMSRADGRFVARVRVDDEAILSAPVSQDGVLYAYAKSGRLTAYTVSE